MMLCTTSTCGNRSTPPVAVLALLVLVAATGITATATAATTTKDQQTASYGVDVSVPVHYLKVSTNYDHLPHNADPANNPIIPPEYEDMPIQPLGDRLSSYRQYIANWKQSYIAEGDDPSEVDLTEADRVKSNREQSSIVVNFTETGYKKIRAPKQLQDVIAQFWNTNKQFEAEEDEVDIINQFDNPTAMINLEDAELQGGGSGIKKIIWDAVRDLVQEWTGQKLVGSSLYGIRVYKEGAVLLPHTDRLPLVCSAIYNVAQDVDEPWPLEVYGYDGKAVNITMDPGDLVLYESHSLIHGRPFPLIGRDYANVFIHFKPAETVKEGGLPSYIVPDADPKLVDVYYRDAMDEYENNSETALSDGMEEDYDQWDENNERWEEAHLAAYRGDVALLTALIDKDSTVVNKVDEDDWAPLAYAAYGGRLEAVRFLVERGANVRERVENSDDTAISVAISRWGESHPVVQFLAVAEVENVMEEL